MTRAASGNWAAVRTIMRWRVRMIRNSIATDSGFLGAALGGIVYLAIVVVVATQARAGGIITREVAVDRRELALTLLGMHLLLVACVQAAALYFFRISLQGDFRTARWRALPVGRHTLRRAYLIDSLLNPGAIAALVATWLLVFTYAAPSTALSVIGCLLVGPIFVYLSQSIFVLASDVLSRFRVAGSWLLLGVVAVAGVLVGAYVVRLSSATAPGFVRGIMLSDATRIALSLPPWGVPLFVLRRLDSGQVVLSFGSLIAAVIAASLLLVAANRIAASTDLS